MELPDKPQPDSQAALDRWLDETLEETFATSDPIGARSVW